MSTTLRAAIYVAFLSCFSVIVFAQDPTEVDGPKSSPVITAAVAGETVRFTSPAGSIQMRVQILSESGDPVFDSTWRDGNVFDWAIETPGQPLTGGSYRCVVMAKDLEGRVTRKEATVIAQGGQVSIERRAGVGGLTLAGPGESGPKITALTHDGTNGAIVSTGGDLSFRFGNFLAGKDAERMRLTSDGKLGIGTDKPQETLDVNGLVRTSKGILFEDGTILTAIGGQLTAVEPPDIMRRRGGGPDQGNIGRVPKPPILPLAALTSSSAPRPRLNFAPAYQFTVGDLGVTVGTTNPNYKLDVSGPINTNTGYNIGGHRIVFSDLNLSGNTIVGYIAGNVNSGSVNSFFGTQAGQANTTGSGNSFFGYQSGVSNVSGGNNSFFGLFSGVFSTGSWDTFIGGDAGFGNTSGSRNTALGYAALSANVDGNDNTAVGYSALSANTSGSQNIALGRNAGALVTGSYNINIGNNGVAGESGIIRIGDPSYQVRAYIVGARGVTTAQPAVPLLIDTFGQLGTVSSSRRYKYDISDMDLTTDDLMRLRPVTFRYLAHGDNAPLQYGLIAEEVEEVYPELVARNKDGEVDTVMYQFLAPMLLNHVQKQHRTIEEQQKTIEALSEKLEALGQRLEALETQAARD